MSRRPGAMLLGVGLLAALAAAGCATGGTKSSPTEVEQLQDRIVALQRKAAMNEVEIARLTQRIAELETTAPGGPTARPVRAVTPPPPVVEAAEPEEATPPPPVNPKPPARPAPVTRTPAPRPMLEVTDIDLPPASSTPPAPPAPKPAPPKVTPAPAKPAAKPAEKPAEKLAESPRPTAPPPARPAAPSAPSSPSSPSSDAEPPMAAQALYDRGYTLYHQGRYADAEASFQRFLASDPRSELADNAQYWIGECRYSRNDLRGALTAFRETVDRFPQGNKVPDALLKAAQTLEALGDTDKARATYNEVIQKFPTTAAAAVAAERKAKLP